MPSIEEVQRAIKKLRNGKSPGIDSITAELIKADTNFSNFEKAFDSIHRESQWTIMRKYGVPDKIVRIVQLFYEDFQCAVEDQGEKGEWFNIKTGVKQGCNMSGFIFLVIMDWVMRKAVGNDNRYKTKPQDEETSRVGLKTNKDKTKVMRINAWNENTIKLRGLDIEDAEQFTYLGATVCKEGGGMKGIKSRLSKARGAFIRLKHIWNSSSIPRKTKLKLYKALVIPVLLYGCEMNKGDDRMVDVFHNKCLRRILNIQWQEHIKTDEILERASMRPISQEIKCRKWEMIGHILRQDRNNDCNVALTWAPRREAEKRKTEDDVEKIS
ncbi:uncharacterized protein LOC132549148 [Ylistrum balloti]|uniref:uncharacterized protein LOC132549148 n=1 Tax=Ylistrum balloti TaxID=509963 RepID=UPI002905C68B|nr:uncharacterized protein LOC132549148 [Ylistrum balloti]